MIKDLKVEDFSVHKTSKGEKIVKLNESGKWFVFFSTPYCGHCKEFKEEYSKLLIEFSKPFLQR